MKARNVFGPESGCLNVLISLIMYGAQKITSLMYQAATSKRPSIRAKYVFGWNKIETLATNETRANT